MPLDNQVEPFVWVDAQDHILGTITRREAHSGTNKIHRAISIFLFTPDYQELLLQQRSLNKDTNPGFWSDSVGGHVTLGQTYLQAAHRETREELGLPHLTLRFHSKHLFDLQNEQEFFSLYTAVIPKTTPIHFDPDEIQAVSWIKLTNLPHFIATHSCSSAFLQCWEKLQVRLPVQSL